MSASGCNWVSDFSTTGFGDSCANMATTNNPRSAVGRRAARRFMALRTWYSTRNGNDRDLSGSRRDFEGHRHRHGLAVAGARSEVPTPNGGEGFCIRFLIGGSRNSDVLRFALDINNEPD